MLTVKDVAKKFNISEHAVRYYSDENLIPNLKRDKNNNRIFDEEALNWIQEIICLRNCGMSIKSIKEYVNLCLIGDSTVKERKNIILEQKKLIDEEIKKLNQSSIFLNHKLEIYDKVLSNQIKDPTNPKKW